MQRFSFRFLTIVVVAVALLVGGIALGSTMSGRAQGVTTTPLSTIPAAPVNSPPSLPPLPPPLPPSPPPMAPAVSRTIAVTGTGIATLAPDVARFSVGVTEQGANLTDVQGKVATETDAITTALRNGSVDVQKDVKTSNYSIQLMYDYPKDKSAVLSGYRVSNTLNVTVRDISGNHVGVLLDAVVRAGANNVGTISFGLANPDTANRTAREEAMKNAKAKADALAQASGSMVGLVITISDTSSTPSAPREVALAAPAASSAAAPVTTPIQSGETSVTVTVSVTYMLQ